MVAGGTEREGRLESKSSVAGHLGAVHTYFTRKRF